MIVMSAIEETFTSLPVQLSVAKSVPNLPFAASSSALLNRCIGGHSREDNALIVQRSSKPYLRLKRTVINNKAVTNRNSLKWKRSESLIDIVKVHTLLKLLF